MSFTASVKDELSRIPHECASCDYALLASIVRICGNLSLQGKKGAHPACSLVISTETGVVARVVINLAHALFDVETYLTVRHSNLHKTRNYVIQIPDQPKLYDCLRRLQILDEHLTLCPGVPTRLLEHPCCARALLRGAFMAGGFIADPRTAFHLELSLASLTFAQELQALAQELGIVMRINTRRASTSLYIKKFDDILLFLQVIVAERLHKAFENVRRVKDLKNDVNRRVNAEIANQARSTDAALDQILLIEQVEKKYDIKLLPRALRQFCELRSAYPELSLAALGERASPVASKQAMYHRLLRLQALVAEDADDTQAQRAKGV